MSSYATKGIRGAFTSSRPYTKILLDGVPTHATSGDVRRALLQAGIRGCNEVSIVYEHAKPTGRVLLGLATSEACQEARNLARQINLFGSDLSAEYFMEDTPRRNELGYGPSASVEPQTAVLITGLPYVAPYRQLKMNLLRGFQLAKGEPLTSISIPDQSYHVHSRILVRLANAAEAHRLVRTIHMTTYGDNPLPIRAELLY